MKKDKILINIDLPPPMHGMNYINNIIYKNLKDEDYKFNILNLSSSLVDNEKVTAKKVMKSLNVVLDTWKVFFRTKPCSLYIILSGTKYGILRDVIMQLPAILFNKKLILHIHGFTHYKTYKSSVLYKILFKILSKNSTLIVLCEKQKQKTALVMNRDSVVLHNCLSSQSTFEPKTRDAKILKLCYISNISKGKGTIDLMRAISNNLNIELVIAGKFLDNEVEFNDIVEKSTNISYIGFADEKIKKELLKKSDIFCLPSKLEEGSPITIIEAMSYGLPILATDKGCIKDMIDGIGYVLDNNYTALDILDGLSYIDSNYGILSVNSRARYDEVYSQKKFIEKLEKILNGEINNVQK
jgi:glycosyltransferase involved in cell wall biosynthesis